MAKVCKGHQNRLFSSSCFDSLLGLFLEVFWGPKSIKNRSQRPLQKLIEKVFPKRSPKWSQRGPKTEPKSSKMTSWNSPLSTSAPKWPPCPLQHRFWSPFGSILGSFLNDFGPENILQKATVQTTATTEMKRKLQPRQPRPASDRTVENPGWHTTQQ